MPDKDDLVCLGAIAGAWGVQGAVRLKSFCSEPAAIANYAPLLTEDGRSFNVTGLKALKGAFSARLTGISSKEQADALRGTRLYAPRDRMPALPDDEYYHADLIGLEVFDTGGGRLGRIKAVMNHGAGDLLEIARPGSPDLMIVFTREAVPNVDLAEGRIVVDPPEDDSGE